MDEEKLRRLAAKGFIKTPESHPEEYAAYLGARGVELKQLLEIRSEYMGEDASDDGEYDDLDDRVSDDYGEESFA